MPVVGDFDGDADMQFFTADLTTNSGALTIEITSSATTSKLFKLNGYTLVATPQTSAGKIYNWELDGTLADKLGIAQE